MSAPRTKRPFAGDASQRHITTFFSRTASSSENQLSAALSTTHLAAEPPSALPHSVQVDLLAVGMRVRKSVPEGYKTGGPSAFALWTDAAPAQGPGPQMGMETYSQSLPQQGFAYRQAATTQLQQDPFVVQPPITSIHPSASTAVVSSRRELLPFCGLHKVGGLSAQPSADGGGVVFADTVFNPSAADDGVPPVDQVPGLTLSRASAASSAPASSQTGRKRVYDTIAIDTTYQLPQQRQGQPWADHDGDVSPRTVLAAPPFPSTGGMADGDVNGRAMAVPRRRSRKVAVGVAGQENDVEGGLRPEDFDDAGFLVWADRERRETVPVDFDMGGL